MWEIKGKNNAVKAIPSTKPEYNGVWMEECYVTVNVESPTPVNFEIGDYIIYRGERFEINYDPGKIKCAPRFAKGDAFRYENIKFNSLADELTRCDFLDVVLNDNQLHFTGLPKFRFYGSVQDLANRIQANLDKTYGKGTWSVVVSPEYTDRTEINVKVDSPMKVQGALSFIVNDFKTYYTIKGRTLTIGAAGIPAGHLFKYGKGNGLYEIEQNAEADQAIVTRLRAYGSTRNLPHRYYNSLTGADGQKLIPDNMAVQNLMLPSFPYTTQDPYIDSANKATLGIREDTVFFDGSQEGLEEIYPSIEGMTAEDLHKAGVTCNATGALDEIVSATQMTDNGVGKIEGDKSEAEPPTFKVTLKDLGFDINDHLTTETATISFKSGKLGGRDFEIVKCTPTKTGNNVTGYELELNRVYDDDIKLWFPYKDYNAAAGDKFVLLHIGMPEVYIKAAAVRLKEAAQKWLSKNDYSRSIYAPKIDEIFMARQHDVAMASGGTIKSLHDTIKEGMLLLFEDEDLNINASIFIDRLTIKEEGKIPTYEVVLKEEKTVGRLDKMQNQIDSLASGKGQGAGYTAAQIRSFIDAYGGSRFLSKIKDDRTPYKISSDKAFEIGEYIAGASGGIFGKDADGDSFIEIARIYVRVRAFFEQLTIIEANTLAGKQYITPGGSIKCTKVEESTSANTAKTYRCYFLSEQDGEKTESKMVVGDQAVSQMFNAKSGASNKIGNHRYWRLVTGVNNDAYADSNGNHYGYIELSATDCESGSDIPKAGDIIAQLGNRTDRTRQTAIIISTVDADSPSMKFFSGINSFSLADKTTISFGSDPTTGQIFFRLGASGSKQYLEYTQSGGLKIAGSISTLSTIGGKPVGDYVSDAAKAEADRAKAELEASIKALQEQVDGVIESFSGFGAPSLTNFPAVEWTTDAERKAHDRDIYTDRTPYVDDATTPTSGHSWKWYYNTPTDYGWTKIADSDAVKALQMAQMSVRDSDVYFISHTSATSAPPLPVIGINGEITDAKGWSTSAPAWQQDKYIWQTTYTVKGDGSVSFTDPTCISGRNGKGIASITEQYYLSTSRDNPVGSSVGWTDRDHREQWTVGKYWWTRSKITYTDGKSEYIGEVCVSGADGADGTSVLVRYSSDGSNWHPTMLPTDIYMQTSSDGGQSWSPVMRFMGSSYTENLMLNTEKQIDGLYTDDGDHWKQWPDHKVRMEQGKTYTISAFTNSPAFTDVHLGSIGLQRCTLWLVTPSPQPSEGAVNQIVSGTDMATDGSTGHTFVWSHPTGDYCLRTNFYSPGIWIVRKVKVEEGRNPSPVWTPASSEMVGKDGKWQKPQWAKNNDPDNAPTSGWQDAPMTAMPGEYVWTRSGWVIPPATEPSSYGDAVRITGDAGSNGSDVYRLDLDNEMAAVAVRPDGGLDSNSVLPTANASVYKGATKLTSGVVFSIPQYDGVAGVSISPEGKVQVLGTVMSNVARITVQAVVDGVTLTTIMTVYKVRPGHDGASAKVVTVNADSQVFSYADDFSGSPSPSAIRITASVQGLASPVYSWSYKFPGDADFTAYGVETGAVLTLSPTWQQWGNHRSVTWRCTVDGVHDEVTVAKVSSGKNGADAYTVLLTNESHVFEGDDSKAVPSVAECVVTVYKGNTLIPATVGSLSTGVTGLTASFVGGSSGNAVTIQFNATSALTARQGTVEIPITADGKTFSKTFSWSLALRGQSVSVDKGLSSVTYQTSTNYTTPPTGQWLTAVPSVPNGHYLWTRTIVAYTDGNSTTAYSVARQGENGSNGTNGSNGDNYTNNILRNTDFRDGDRHWWFMANGVTAVDTSRVFQGRYSVKSTQSGASSMKPCGWIAGGDNEFIPAKKGDVITLSCWVCCDNPSAIDGGVVAEIYWRDAAKQRIATSVYNHASFMPSGPGTWTLHSLTSDVAPEGTEYAELRCQLTQNGTVWFNGIKAEYGANTAPVWTPFAEGTAISSDSVTYATTSVPVQPADSAFTATDIGQIALTPGIYLWSKSEVRYSDGTVSKSYAVSRLGADGTKGTPGLPGADGKTTYVHFAYANSADGVKDFSVTPFSGAKYIGVCTDYNEADPADPSLYTWSEYRGADAVIYEIMPSVDKITRSFTGELSASSLRCSVYKTVGGTRTLTVEKYLRYTRYPDGATGAMPHLGMSVNTVDILDDTTEVVFELYNSSTELTEANLLDRERVLVLTDAAGLEIGGTNLMRNTAATIERSYTDYGDHYFQMEDHTVHMEQGKVYTISAQSNAEFIDASKHSNVNGGVLGDWVSLWIVSPSPQPTDGTAVNILVTGDDMTSDGSKGHTFKWEKPTGDYELRVNFYAPGTWWVKKIMLERGNVTTSWSPSPEDTDYLTRALMEDATIENGLILATLIKLGYTDPDGLRKIMAGVNGSYMSDSDIAFWSGGDMIDKLPPQEQASAAAVSERAASADGATYVMRMDGTGYMADGVLRFEKDHIGVGDTLVLDRDGLHLMDNNDERLVVANVAIDDSYISAQAPKKDLSKNWTEEISCEPVSPGSSIYGNRSTLNTVLHTMTLPKGAVVSVRATYSQWHTQPQLGTVASVNANGYFQLRRGSTVVASGSSLIHHTVQMDGEYVLEYRMGQSVSGSPDSRYLITLTRNLSLSGYVSYPTSDKLTLGNNGLAAIFGQIVLVAADNTITFRAGDYGFRLSPTRGIQYNTTGLDTGWKNLA